jgi:glycosyltransferase involved in cell wall biosynthesis
VFVGELTPLDGQHRQWRYGMLADALRNAGHDVVRWFPSYAHGTREQRDPGIYPMGGDFGDVVRVIATPSYKRHVSLKRLWFNRRFAQGFLDSAYDAVPPDVIVVGMPAPEMCDAVARYSRVTNIPYVIDVRDLWPDIFVDILPSWGRWAGSMALWPLYHLNRRSFPHASAIYALSDSYLDWGVAYAGRRRTNADAVVPMGCTKPVEPGPDADVYWQERGVDKHKRLCVFAGTLSEQFDIDTVLAAAREMQDDLDTQFVICGDGPYLERYLKVSMELTNVVMPGWVGGDRLTWLLAHAAVALAPYRRGPAYNSMTLALNLPITRMMGKATLSNKIMEYSSHGLPIVTSIGDPVGVWLESEGMARRYPDQNGEMLVQQLRLLLKDDALRAQMAGASLAVFKREFDADLIYPKLVERLEKLHVSDRNRR